MNDIEFENYCDHYEFTKLELREYLDLQVKLMNISLIHCRNKGDKRDKNIIFTEWINIHSQQFRYMWVALRQSI